MFFEEMLSVSKICLLQKNAFLIHLFCEGKLQEAPTVFSRLLLSGRFDDLSACWSGFLIRIVSLGFVFSDV